MKGLSCHRFIAAALHRLHLPFIELLLCRRFSETRNQWHGFRARQFLSFGGLYGVRTKSSAVLGIFRFAQVPSYSGSVL
jgi:hypothetical protein